MSHFSDAELDTIDALVRIFPERIVSRGLDADRDRQLPLGRLSTDQPVWSAGSSS